MHHLRDLVCRFGRVHLNFCLVTGVDYDADNHLSVTEGHTAKHNVVI